MEDKHEAIEKRIAILEEQVKTLISMLNMNNPILTPIYPVLLESQSFLGAIQGQVFQRKTEENLIENSRHIPEDSDGTIYDLNEPKVSLP